MWKPSAVTTSFFALWPIFSNQKTGIGTELPQKQQALLPLYSLLRSPLRDSSTYLWPFFTYIDEREKKYREWEAPWPFIVVARGEGKTTTRFWPLFSRAHNETLESDFYLWPIYKYNRQHAAPSDRERTRILFFLFSHITEKNEETGDAMHRTDFWPLFTARRDLNGNQRLQILSLLEPILPNNKSIERDWSPLWSLWRSEKNAQTGATSQSLLWNLYRRDATPESKKCSLLFGLFQYQSNAEGKHWRLFMFQNIGEMVLLFWRTLLALPLAWRQRQKVFDQFFEIGNASLLMVCILSFFIGGVIALQTGPVLVERGLASAVGGVVGISMCQRTGAGDDGHPDRRPHRLGDGGGNRLHARLSGNRRAAHDEHQPDPLPGAAARGGHRRSRCRCW